VELLILVEIREVSIALDDHGWLQVSTALGFLDKRLGLLRRGLRLNESKHRHALLLLLRVRGAHLVILHLVKDIADFGVLPVLTKHHVVTREVGEKIGQALRGNGCISPVILILLAQFGAGERVW